MRKIKVVVVLVRQLQHGFTKNAKVSPNLTVAQICIDNIELIQQRCMNTIFPGCSNDAILEMTNLPTLHDRRTTLCRPYFNKMNRSNHKLCCLVDEQSHTR